MLAEQVNLVGKQDLTWPASNLARTVAASQIQNAVLESVLQRRYVMAIARDLSRTDGALSNSGFRRL